MKYIKSIICFCLTLAIITFTAVYCCYAESKPVPVYGDADGNGIISIADATLIQEFLVEIYFPDSCQLEICDVNEDDTVNVKDVTMIQKFIAELADTGRVGKKYITEEETTVEETTIAETTVEQTTIEETAIEETTVQQTTADPYPDIADYVKKEAFSVADKVNGVRKSDSMVIAMLSDFHTNGQDISAQGVLHACQAVNLISSKIPVDIVTFLGDIMVNKIDDSGKIGFEYADKCFSEIQNNLSILRLQGNHDEFAGIDITPEAQQKYWEYIGSYNQNVTTDNDNLFRNYGYRDFEDKKIRMIYLNSVDVSDVNSSTDTNISPAQFNWLINTALNLSDKSDESEWGVIVLSHHPLNIYGTAGNLLNLLDAYKGRSSGSFNVDNSTISYDFSTIKAEFICHFHGHIHNYRAEVMGENKVLSVTVPNACFGRNNEYGTAAAYSDSIRMLYGDADKNGNQRVFYKTANSAKDTSFCVVTIDRKSKCVYAHNYGTGIDRFYNYETGNELN